MKPDKNVFIPEVTEKNWGALMPIINTQGFCGRVLYLEPTDWLSSKGIFMFHAVRDLALWVLDGCINVEIKGDKLYRIYDCCGIRIKPLTRYRYKGVVKTAKVLEIGTAHLDEDIFYETPDEQPINPSPEEVIRIT